MPQDDRVRSLDRVRDTIEVHDDDFLPALRELITRNSYVTPGAEPIVEDLPSAAGRVDAHLGRSKLLQDIDTFLSGQGGGIASDRQLWTSSATVVRADAPSAPCADRFEPVRRGGVVPTHARPSGGLWTSTALTGSLSPWSLWREVGVESSLFVGPSRSWLVAPRPDAGVYEVAGARDWVTLVSGIPRTTAAGVLPDWPAVAGEYDAVHFTTTAAVALQGTSYRLPDGSRTVPMYVDVECTVWLRWAFTAVVPVPEVPAVRSPGPLEASAGGTADVQDAQRGDERGFSA